MINLPMMSTTIHMTSYSKKAWYTRSKYGSSGKCSSISNKTITTRYKGRTCCGYPTLLGYNLNGSIYK